jgi:hypothetical protein
VTCACERRAIADAIRLCFNGEIAGFTACRFLTSAAAARAASDQAMIYLFSVFIIRIDAFNAAPFDGKRSPWAFKLR